MAFDGIFSPKRVKLAKTRVERLIFTMLIFNLSIPPLRQCFPRN